MNIVGIALSFWHRITLARSHFQLAGAVQLLLHVDGTRTTATAAATAPTMPAFRFELFLQLLAHVRVVRHE